VAEVVGVSSLPPALAPWAAQLAPFAPDLALTLGAWARRIAPALGPFRGPRVTAGEPDGLAGISRRGPYERLLLSEWLLAQEIPAEFTRRAAAGEHLFLDRGRRDSSAGRRSIALLDAGPDQLGAPRIAQLALLVVLATRAEAAGTAFSWGVVQEPDHDLVDGFGPDLARRFLMARSERPISTGALAAWIERLPPPAASDDLWLVGGAALSRAAPAGASRLVAEDVTEPGARQVRLLLEPRGASRREVTLDLPSAADCTRLLRDPFRTASAEPARAPGHILPGSAILFAPFTRRVAVRLAGADVLDAHVPSSPREKSGHARRLTGGPGLVAVGWNGKRLFKASLQTGAIVFARASGSAIGSSVPGHGVPGPAAPMPGDGPGPCYMWPRGGRRAWILDAAGVLHVAELGGASCVASARVSTVLCARGWLAYVAERESSFAREGNPGGSGAPLWLELVVHTSDHGRHTRDLGPGSGRAFLSAKGGPLLIATENAASGLWTVQLLAMTQTGSRGPPSSEGPGRRVMTSRQLRPPSGTAVVGALLGRDGEPALLLLEEDRRDFTLLDRSGLRLVHGATGKVASAAVSPERILAYTTRSGALVAHSIDLNTALLHLLPAAEVT
jgi:hypothetical protein